MYCIYVFCMQKIYQSLGKYSSNGTVKMYVREHFDTEKCSHIDAKYFSLVQFSTVPASTSDRSQFT